MIEKELFKNQIIYLFRGHGINEIDNEMVKIWYEECKELESEEFKIAINRSLYSPKYPKLYDILINLPKYDNDKSINDYCKRMKEIEVKKSKAVKFDVAAYIKKLEESQ